MATTSNRFVKPGASALAIAIAIGGFYEGTRLHAYHDVGGVPTICMGETHGVFMGMTKTYAECTVMFSGAMQWRVTAVERMFKHPQPRTRIAALAEFAYNEGLFTLQQSGVVQLIDNGRVNEGCDRLMHYTRTGSTHPAGLRKRRISDRELCLMAYTN